MSTALVEAPDQVAAAQHRKRANLVQHVRWECVLAEKKARLPDSDEDGFYRLCQQPS